MKKVGVTVTTTEFGMSTAQTDNNNLNKIRLFSCENTEMDKKGSVL